MKTRLQTRVNMKTAYCGLGVKCRLGEMEIADPV